MATFARTLARQNHECPRCGAKKGEACRTPLGRAADIHVERTSQLTPREWDQTRVTVSFPSEGGQVAYKIRTDENVLPSPGCYTLDLYCMAEGHEGNEPHTYMGETRQECDRNAKADGWAIRRDRIAVCPRCNT